MGKNEKIINNILNKKTLKNQKKNFIYQTVINQKKKRIKTYDKLSKIKYN